MIVSDYIIEFLIEKGIRDVFGYPGGMVTYLMESLDKYKDYINVHTNYHEQASSFSACGYAQTSRKPGVAYATSGPGATNMITGICNSFFDSIPTIFITGQVNTDDCMNGLSVRQKGFQETNIVSLVNNVTKYAVYVDDAEDIRYHLEKAYYLCLSGRPGPVLLDIPIDIQRTEVTPIKLKPYVPYENLELSDKHEYSIITDILKKAKRPCILAGAAISNCGMREEFRELINKLQIPVVTSMISVDTLPSDNKYNFGFIGAYGNRHSNFIIAKSDLIISIGSRMDVRQVGSQKENFAPNSKLIRIDIDKNELTNKLKDDEVQIVADLKDIILFLEDKITEIETSRFKQWNLVCDEIKETLKNIDILEPNKIIANISKSIPNDTVVTTDVGQNQVWVSQNFLVKENQRILFSGGHGSMGYSLPAAIGAYYGSLKNIISFNGDGGIQMNIQELEFVKRENLPIKIIVLNNSSLGMIRHFQEMYFKSNYSQTKAGRGYSSPDFEKIAQAYDLKYLCLDGNEYIDSNILEDDNPYIIEIKLSDETYVYPKLAMNKLNQDQEPPLDREVYNYIMNL